MSAAQFPKADQTTNSQQQPLTQIIEDVGCSLLNMSANPEGVDDLTSQYYSFPTSHNTDYHYPDELPSISGHPPSQITASLINPPTEPGLSQNCENLSKCSNMAMEKEGDCEQLPDELRNACLQIVSWLMEQVQLAEARGQKEQKEQKLAPVYSQFCEAYQKILKNSDIEESIRSYSQILIKYWKQEMFFQHFVETSFLSVLMGKLHEFKYAHEIVKPVFGCLEYLLKGLGSEAANVQDYKEEQFIYLLVMINKLGFTTQNYRFSDTQDWAYYVHFMKLLVRIINQADTLHTRLKDPSHNVGEDSSYLSNQLQQQEEQQKYSKYLSIFFNKSTPTFPLLLKLLYFYKWPDAIIQTSVKLCLLEISNHPNAKLQKYFVNFPFITFYILYCCKLSDSIEKYLTLCGSRSAHQKQSQKEEMLEEQIIEDLKFMEDYLRVEEFGQNGKLTKCNNLDKCMSMYINAFMYYIGRGVYQTFNKYASEDNINGLINGMLLLIKILRVNTILKIKLGFQEMLHKYINCSFWSYLKAKRERLDTDKWWMFDQCQAAIKEHAENILYNQQLDQKSSEKTSHELTNSQFIASSAVKATIENQEKKQVSYSSLMFKAVRSYIPITNSNWLLNQIKKISQVFGLEISLNKEVQHFGREENSSVYKDSFVYIMEQIQQYHYHGSNSMVLKRKMSLLSRSQSPIKPNPFLTSLLSLANKGMRHGGSGRKKGETSYEDNSEELLYYYLVLVCSINDDPVYSEMRSSRQQSGMNSINLQQICELLKIVKKCKSLMLVGIMYWYIRTLDYQLHQANMDFCMPTDHTPQGSLLGRDDYDESKDTLAAELLESYLCTMSKLVYYILTEGWDTFTKHIREIKKVIWSHKHKTGASPYDECNKKIETQFSGDIFRDIDCDIVYFVMLRHIFGTRNEDSESDSCQDQLKDVISKQVKVPCQLAGSGDLRAFLVLDGQYLKFMTTEDILITKKPLSVSNFNIYYQEDESGKYVNQVNDQHMRSEIKQKGQAMLELVDKNINGECFTVYFTELALREYAAKQIKCRKKMTADLEMSLRTMKFQIED